MILSQGPEPQLTLGPGRMEQIIRECGKRNMAGHCRHLLPECPAGSGECHGNKKPRCVAVAKAFERVSERDHRVQQTKQNSDRWTDTAPIFDFRDQPGSSSCARSCTPRTRRGWSVAAGYEIDKNISIARIGGSGRVAIRRGDARAGHLRDLVQSLAGQVRPTSPWSTSSSLGGGRDGLRAECFPDSVKQEFFR